MASLVTWLVRLVLLGAFSASFLLLLMEGRRLIAGPGNLETALSANPYNAATRLAIFSREMEAGTPDGFAKARAVAEDGRKLHPEDGRFISAVATARLMAGEDAEAGADFDEALKLLPTDGLALKGSLYFKLRDSDWAGFADKFLLLSQRWPNEVENVAPYVKAATQQLDARDAILSKLSAKPEALSDVIGVLAADPQTQAAAIDMLMQIDRSDIDKLSVRVPVLVASLVSQNRISEALLLDHYFFGRPKQQAGGFVNNGRFSTEPSNSMFDWRFPKNNGVSVDRVTLRDVSSLGEILVPLEGDDGTEPPKVLRLAFQDSPLQLKTGIQTLTLPAGQFRLGVVARASDNFAGPDPIKAEIYCTGGRSPLISLSLAEAGEKWQRASADFSVPDSACQTQTIEVRNKFQTMSWRDRYRGSIEIAEVSVVGIQ